MESTIAFGCSPGAITRRGNLAAYATMDDQNARNEATYGITPSTNNKISSRGTCFM